MVAADDLDEVVDFVDSNDVRLGLVLGQIDQSCALDSMLVPNYLGDLGAVTLPGLLIVETAFVEPVEGRLEVALAVGFMSVGLVGCGAFAAVVPFGFAPSFSLAELTLEEAPEEGLLAAGLVCETSVDGFGIGSAGGGRASLPDTARSSLGSVGLIVAGVSSTAETVLSGFIPGASCDGRAVFLELVPDLLTKSPMALSVRGLIAGEAEGVASIADSGIVSTPAHCFRCSFSCDTVVFNSAILSASCDSLRLKLSLRVEGRLETFVIVMSVCG